MTVLNPPAHGFIQPDAFRSNTAVTLQLFRIRTKRTGSCQPINVDPKPPDTPFK